MGGKCCAGVANEGARLEMRVGIALGSNLDERLENLRPARRHRTRQHPPTARPPQKTPSLRPHVSGAESLKEPWINYPADGANPPRIKGSSGSSSKRSGFRNHASSYSKVIVSLPRARLQWAQPTGCVV